MTDQQTTLLQAILLELKCMNEAMRATTSQGDNVAAVRAAADAFDAVTSHSDQAKQAIADAMLGGTVPAAAPGESLESRVAAAMQEIGAWSASAFKSAVLQPKDDEFGRRFIEHGATCYANCFFRLQTALGGASPPP